MSITEYILLGLYLASILAVSMDTDAKYANHIWFNKILPFMEGWQDAAAAMDRK